MWAIVTVIRLRGPRAALRVSQCSALALGSRLACANMLDSHSQRHVLRLQVIETLSAWCDRQLQGYSNAIQNDREELEDSKTQWLRTQARSLRKLPVNRPHTAWHAAATRCSAPRQALLI